MLVVKNLIINYEKFLLNINSYNYKKFKTKAELMVKN